AGAADRGGERRPLESFRPSRAGGPTALSRRGRGDLSDGPGRSGGGRQRRVLCARPHIERPSTRLPRKHESTKGNRRCYVSLVALIPPLKISYTALLAA